MLTSSGLDTPKIKKKFLSLINKKVQNTKIAVIHTIQKPQYIEFVNNVGRELVKTGLLHPHISYIDITRKKPSIKLSDYDAVYVCGGNTFYILDRLRKTGLYKSLKEFAKSGGVYIGSSAGSIIASSDISLAGWGSEADKNEINLKDLNGLNLTKISVFPHYKIRLKKEVEEFQKTVDYPVQKLKDRQALIIKGKTLQLLN